MCLSVNCLLTLVRIALAIEYDGSAYSGWQWQKERATIQAVVERALRKVANETVSVICAGRTDAGVHALEQIVHFDSCANRNMRAWTMGTNTYLPDNVRIIWAKQVSDDFHARYSAIARYYRYVIQNRKTKSALLFNQVTWVYSDLDQERMKEAAQYLIGKHDFSSFRAKGCQSKSAIRFLHLLKIHRNGDRIVIDVVANAFLHHMVRNIMGVLIEIGAGKRNPEWAQQVLKAKDRQLGGVTAPPFGLFLKAVCYPENFSLPKHPLFEYLRHKK